MVENDYLRVEVDGPGIVRSLRSLADDREWLAPVAAPVRIELWPETDYVYDYGGPMKAWGLGITDARENAIRAGAPVATESGPVRATVRTQHLWRQSRFTTEVSLYAGQPWVELRIEIDWRELEVLARLCIEPLLKAPLRRAFGIPFGCEQATGDEREVPALGWVDIASEDGGVALLNRDRPGHTFRDDSLRVSLVRCATGDYDERTDSGIIRTVLRILPHAASLAEAGLPRLCDDFLHPLVAWQSEPADKPGAAAAGPLRVDGPGVMLSTWKVAEDLGGYVVRLWESTGRPADAAMTLGPALAAGQVFETNLLEDKAAPLPRRGNVVRLSFAPFEIKTLLIETAEPVSDAPGLRATFFSG